MKNYTNNTNNARIASDILNEALIEETDEEDASKNNEDEADMDMDETFIDVRKKNEDEADMDMDETFIDDEGTNKEHDMNMDETLLNEEKIKNTLGKNTQGKNIDDTVIDLTEETDSNDEDEDEEADSNDEDEDEISYGQKLTLEEMLYIINHNNTRRNALYNK